MQYISTDSVESSFLCVQIQRWRIRSSGRISLTFHPHSATLSPDVWKLEKLHKLKGNRLSEGERRRTISGHCRASHYTGSTGSTGWSSRPKWQRHYIRLDSTTGATTSWRFELSENYSEFSESIPLKQQNRRLQEANPWIQKYNMTLTSKGTLMAFTLFFKLPHGMRLKPPFWWKKKKRQQQQHVSRQTRSHGTSNFKALWTRLMIEHWLSTCHSVYFIHTLNGPPSTTEQRNFCSGRWRLSGSYTDKSPTTVPTGLFSET